MNDLNENLLKNEPATSTSPIIQMIEISKVKFVPTIEFLNSLNLKNFTPHQIKSYSKSIGAYIYFFKICPSDLDKDSYM